MLIVNADDWGRNTVATDNARVCFERGRITSTSAMVYMADSGRAADLARMITIPTGLHINFSESFTAPDIPPELRRRHERIRRFLRRGKFALLLYHPFLRQDFRYVFQAQLREYQRLFEREPTHFDGHQHLHLCTNVLLQRILPEGAKVRRSFSFHPGEKGPLNRAYRRVVDGKLARRHVITDFFFALSLNLSPDRLATVLEPASSRNVELMTHPEVPAEFAFLQSEDFAASIRPFRLGSYADLDRKPAPGFTRS